MNENKQFIMEYKPLFSCQKDIKIRLQTLKTLNSEISMLNYYLKTIKLICRISLILLFAEE